MTECVRATGLKRKDFTHKLLEQVCEYSIKRVQSEHNVGQGGQLRPIPLDYIGDVWTAPTCHIVY